MKHKRYGILLILMLMMICILSGCGLFDTMLSLSEGQPTSFRSAYDLSSGKAYVWHHKDGDIREDISKGADEDVFFTCIWKGKI